MEIARTILRRHHRAYPSRVKRTAATPTDEQRAAAHRARLVARGERLAELRLRAGFKKQLHVYRDTGAVDSGTLSKLERGEQDMTASTAEDLANAYHVSLDVLMGRAPVPPINDRYPARAEVRATVEYQQAPAAARDHFAGLEPDGAEVWSIVQWVRVLEKTLQLYEISSGAMLPPGARSPLKLPPRRD